MTEETAQEGIGPCPKCKTGVVRKTPKGWGCSRYKEAGCDFVIWAQVAGKTIGEAVARELVTGGMSARVIEGFVSKEKKTFGARLKLDASQRVVFAFEERPPAQDLGPCPACKEGRVRATPKGWGCYALQARAARSPSGASTTARRSPSTSPGSSSSTA